jgi:hypothetical protein
MEGILICGIIFFTTYKIIELFVLQRGRRQILQKMSEISPEMLQQNVNSFNAFQNDGSRSNQFLMLRLGGLALGISAGWILGWYLNSTQFNMHENLSFYQQDMINSTTVATTAFCTGIALIIVYLIERKAYKEAKKEK